MSAFFQPLATAQMASSAVGMETASQQSGDVMVMMIVEITLMKDAVSNVPFISRQFPTQAIRKGMWWGTVQQGKCGKG